MKIKKKRFVVFFLFVFTAALILFSPRTAIAERVRMITNLGNIDVVLFEDITPMTVANFRSYINAGKYANTLIHRSVRGFVIQGGGYFLDESTIYAVEKNAPIVNEFHLSNLRGTIAMAKLAENPDSATSEWFFNLADNSENLDSQNGGFTVFGRVTDQSLAVIDAIAALTAYNASTYLGSAAPLECPVEPGKPGDDFRHGLCRRPRQRQVGRFGGCRSWPSDRGRHGWECTHASCGNQSRWPDRD
jgi:cyclophilin family peptidyl-prolyl cis-trans isomerase